MSTKQKSPLERFIAKLRKPVLLNELARLYGLDILKLEGLAAGEGGAVKAELLRSI